MLHHILLRESIRELPWDRTPLEYLKDIQMLLSHYYSHEKLLKVAQHRYI